MHESKHSCYAVASVRESDRKDENYYQQTSLSSNGDVQGAWTSMMLRLPVQYGIDSRIKSEKIQTPLIQEIDESVVKLASNIEQQDHAPLAAVIVRSVHHVVV